MNRLPRIALCGTALAAFALAAAAQTATPASPPLTTDQRQSNQDARVDRGVNNGELTKPETRRLNAEQAGIAKAQKHAEADGRVTRREQNRLDYLQNKSSKDIHRQKHDKAER